MTTTLKKALALAMCLTMLVLAVPGKAKYLSLYAWFSSYHPVAKHVIEKHNTVSYSGIV